MAKSTSKKGRRNAIVPGSAKIQKKWTKKKNHVKPDRQLAQKKTPFQVVIKTNHPPKTKQGGVSGLSVMQEQMKRRLEGGKFRMLNEQLYTTTGVEAFEEFQKEPELFDIVRRCCYCRSILI
jgi:ribosomal RNA-processing protein 8